MNLRRSVPRLSLPRLGGQLGTACVVAGIIVIALAWNGAASVDFVQGQVPYLLSGGAIGLALCVLGAALMVIQNSRHDRSLVQAELQELNRAVARLANAVASLSTGATNGGASRPATAGLGSLQAADAGTVVTGRSSYHRPTCRLVAGKDLPTTTAAAAARDGLAPCRICQPEAVTSGA